MSTGAQVALSAVIGGTAEKLGGGKFANGAVTGAYVMMFNHLQEHGQEKKLAEKWKDFPRKDYNTLSASERAEHLLSAIQYSNQNDMDGMVPLNSIFENLKNTNTLQNSGIKINQTQVSIDGNEYNVQIIVPLFTSVKMGKFLGSNVQFKGGYYKVAFNNGWYKNYNPGSYQIAVFGKNKYESLINWLDYK